MLTKQDHLKLIRFIQAYQKRNGFSPTTREISRGLGLLSTSAAHYRLGWLERLKLIRRRRPRTARSITVIDIAVEQYIREG